MPRFNACLLAFAIIAAMMAASTTAQAPKGVDKTFPFCNCTTNANATPFMLSSTVVVTPANNRTGISETCFSLVRNPAANLTTKCGSTTNVSKVEFYLNYANRTTMGFVWIRRDGATPTKHAPSWDYKNSVMKVSAAALSINGTTNGIIFTLADLGRQARICIEHKRGFSLTDILRSPVGGGRPAGVTYAVFSGNKKCCPVNIAGGNLVPYPPPPPPPPAV